MCSTVNWGDLECGMAQQGDACKWTAREEKGPWQGVVGTRDMDWACMGGCATRSRREPPLPTIHTSPPPKGSGEAWVVRTGNGPTGGERAALFHRRPWFESGRRGDRKGQ